MKRTKEWWGRLTHDERCELVALERAGNDSYGSSRIPDDCNECGYCSTPHLGSGLCPICSNRLSELYRKTEGGGNA